MVGEILLHKKEICEIKGKKYYMLDVTGEGINGRIKTTPKVYEYVEENVMYMVRIFIKSIFDKYDKPRPCLDMIVRAKQVDGKLGLFEDLEYFHNETK